MIQFPIDYPFPIVIILTIALALSTKFKKYINKILIYIILPVVRIILFFAREEEFLTLLIKVLLQFYLAPHPLIIYIFTISKIPFYLLITGGIPS